jgi:predicted DNA-binding transcriptional regulator AlpA
MTADESKSDDLLSLPALERRYEKSATTIRDWRKRLGFPDPDVVLNPRTFFWRLGTVLQWEAARTVENREAAADV